MISEVNIPVEDTLMRLDGQGAFQGGQVPQYSHSMVPFLSSIALCGPFIYVCVGALGLI